MKASGTLCNMFCVWFESLIQIKPNSVDHQFQFNLTETNYFRWNLDKEIAKNILFYFANNNNF